MENISKLIRNFKKYPDIWFFFGFLLTFTLSVRKVLFFYPLKDSFNEYLSGSIYLSDIFFILTLLSWLFVILCNNSFSLSNILARIPKLSTENVRNWLKFFHHAKGSTGVKQFKIQFSKIVHNCSTWNIYKDKLLFIPALLIIWSFLSIDWSDSNTIAFFRSLKLLEFFLVYIYIRFRLFHHAKGRTGSEQISKEDDKCSTPAPLNVPRPPRVDKQSLRVEAGGTFSSGWNIFRIILLIILVSGLIQGIIGLFQVLFQHSLGLSILRESLINPTIPGVAKIIIGQERYIRAYGLFPHPNILAGFLLISILLSYYSRKMFHACPANCSTWNILKKIKDSPFFSRLMSNVPRLPHWFKMFHVEHFKTFWGGTFWHILMGIQIVALVLTFSKSAIIGLVIALIYIFIHNNSSSDDSVPATSDVPRPPRIDKQSLRVEAGGISGNKKLFHPDENVPRGTFSGAGVEQFKRLRYYFILSLAIFGFILFYFKVDLYALFLKSLGERFLYLAISLKAISEHLFLGLGNGQFVLEMQKYASQALESWQFQPVHNVFLLILSELGMIGLFLFVWFLLEIFAKKDSFNSRGSAPVPSDVPRGTSEEPTCHAEFISASQDNDKILKQVQDDNNKKCLTPAPLNVPRGTFSSAWNIYVKAIVLGFIFIMIFDHYLWDIQQGSLMLWIMLGFLARKK